jgi:peroxiredoxin
VIEVGAPAPEALSRCTVRNAEGTPLALGDLWAHGPTLLYFVRHFGCIGCSEGLATLRPALGELERLGVRVVLVGCGAPHFIPAFLERHALLHAPLRCVTDETLTSQGLAGLAYGFRGGLGPRGLYEQARAFIGGHVAGPVQGDPRQQAGAVMLDGAGVVRLVHRNRSLGDHVPATTLVAAALAIWTDAHASAV